METIVGAQHNFYNDVVEYFSDKELYNKAYENCHDEKIELAVLKKKEPILWLMILNGYRPQNGKT